MFSNLAVILFALATNPPYFCKTEDGQLMETNSGF